MQHLVKLDDGLQRAFGSVAGSAGGHAGSGDGVVKAAGVGNLAGGWWERGMGREWGGV
jgi:hypothetical protein